MLNTPITPPLMKKKKLNKTKKTTTTSSQRFRWKPEMVESLINSIFDLKTQYEFKGLDFEADLVKMYKETRVLMAGKYETGEFGPVASMELDENLCTEELSKMRRRIYEDEKAIKIGYERVKQKAKDIRQLYRKAVTEGRRSGSGKVVCDNWDLLKNIWAGSPATSYISNPISSIPTDSPLDSQNYPEAQEESDDEEDQEETAEATMDNITPKRDQPKKPYSTIC